MAYDDHYLYQRYKSASTLSGVGAGMTIGGVAAMARNGLELALVF